MRTVEFRVVEVNPVSYALVTADTEVPCEGEALERENDNAYDNIGGFNQRLDHFRELVELCAVSKLFLTTMNGIKPPRPS